MSSCLTDQQLERFLDSLQLTSGVDFRHYSRASLRRQLVKLMQDKQLSADQLQQQVEREGQHPHWLEDLTVGHSYLYRDPDVFKRLTVEAFDYLASFARPTIWVAGCSAGDEVFSLAILLHEFDLLERCQIIATDINPSALALARSGQLRHKPDEQCQLRYLQAGGRADINDYFTVDKRNNNCLLLPQLQRFIQIEQHHLLQQPAFTSVELLLCRNVMIYLDQPGRQQLLDVLLQSLVPGGLLVTAQADNLDLLSGRELLQVVSPRHCIYQRRYR